MKPEGLTIKAREALEAAQGVAREQHHQQVSTAHLLLALAAPADGVVRPVLHVTQSPTPSARLRWRKTASRRMSTLSSMPA